MEQHMPRFVILEHDHPVLHWDLMLEAGGVLRTWRLAEAPTAAACAIVAEPLPDHRLAYLDYEGSVSDNRGRVKRWDSGTFDALESNAWMFHGQRLHGFARIECNDGTTWQFRRQPLGPS
ncbi:MAG: hypothetical protein EXS16_00365 [Gemmataceae bacterium]|nr:hypothetical protein [Gemmataceae bacterium]